MKATSEQIKLAYKTYIFHPSESDLDAMEAALNAVFASMEDMPQLQGRVFLEESAEISPEAWTKLGNMLPIKPGDIVRLPGGGEATILHPDHVASVKRDIEIAKGNLCSEDGKCK